jgi:hypothetical protein
MKVHTVRTFPNSLGFSRILFQSFKATSHPPIQWVQGTLSLGVKRPVREADHSPLSCADIKE